MTKAHPPALSSPRETILIVDDDEAVRRGLVWTLNSEYRVIEAASRQEATKLIQHEPIDVVISDLHLPPRLEDISEGLLVVEAARERHPPLQVVVITGTDDKSAAEELVHAGGGRLPDEPGGSIRAALANAMVGLKKQYYGKGPTGAKAWILDDYVFVALEDAASPAELGSRLAR